MLSLLQRHSARMWSVSWCNIVLHSFVLSLIFAFFFSLFFPLFLPGALLACTHHGNGLKEAVSRLDDMKRLAFRVTKDLKSSIDVEDKPVCLTEWSTMNESQNGASSPSVCFEHF